MAKPSVPKPPAILSLKITLHGSKPPIWRRLLVPDSMNFGVLHTAIQIAMGWHGGHLHDFDVGGEHYGNPAELDECANQNRLTLRAVVRAGIGRFRYTYDFGDGWEHLVVIETRPVKTAPAVVPVCIAGKRACPPEDCGGIWGYAALLEALADPAHPEHAERKGWVDEDFDPEAFDIDAVNDRLALLSKPK